MSRCCSKAAARLFERFAAKAAPGFEWQVFADIKKKCQAEKVGSQAVVVAIEEQVMDIEPQVRAGIEALRAAGRPVALRGYLDRDEAAALLRATDVLCIPSRIESIPVVFSDAMQCGCAVATMPVGDLPTLVARHRCGWTADRVDDAAFAAALRRALVEPLPDASALAAAAAAFSVAGSAARILRP